MDSVIYKGFCLVKIEKNEKILQLILKVLMILSNYFLL